MSPIASKHINNNAGRLPLYCIHWAFDRNTSPLGDVKLLKQTAVQWPAVRNAQMNSA